MSFNLIYNYLCKIGIMCLFTYSSNLILLIQKLYDEQVFIDAAFIFSILLLLYTFLGGSIRMLSENKINNSLIISSFVFRLYLGIMIVSLLYYLNFNLIIFLILFRKTIEWIVDPIITFHYRKSSFINFAAIVIDFTAFLFFLFNYQNLFISILWLSTPIIYTFIIIFFSKLRRDLNFKIDFKKIFFSSNYLILVGFEGPAGILAIFFRFLVVTFSSKFLIDTLFITMIFSAISNFFIKILVPVFKNLNIPDLIRNKQMEMFLYIQIILLIMLLPFSNVLSNIAITYFFFIFFIIQLISLLFRKMLISANRLRDVLFRELLIGFFMIIILSLFILLEKTILLGWFYVINAILNWIFYKEMKIKSINKV